MWRVIVCSVFKPLFNGLNNASIKSCKPTSVELDVNGVQNTQRRRSILGLSDFSFSSFFSSNYLSSSFGFLSSVFPFSVPFGGGPRVHRPLWGGLMLASLLLITPPAQSGLAVIDVANLGQAIKNVQNAVQQLSALRNQINNQVSMINLQLTNLQRLPNFIDGDITRQLNTWRNVLANTRGILNNVNAMAAEYDSVFAVSGTDMTDIVANVTGRLMQVDASALNALEVIASLNLDEDQRAVDRVMSAAQSATGQLQALQALNQFNAIATRQFSQSNVLLAKQAELLAINMAQAVSESRQMAEVQRQLNKDFTVRALSSRVVMPILK